MTIKLVTTTGAKKAGTVKLPEAELSDIGVSRVVRATLANDNRERPLVKTRAMVSGGGAKPHRQKGTGRARAGTNRSPIWTGGGITFGPSGQARAYKKIPRTMRRAALLVVLSQLAEGDRLSVISGKLSLAKSKAAAGLLTKVVPDGTALFVVAPDERTETRGVRNLAGVELTTADDCNVYNLVRCDQVVVSEAAFKLLTAPAKKPVSKPAAKPRSAK
jgi:large subunit ribosomal protein L4